MKDADQAQEILRKINVEKANLLSRGCKPTHLVIDMKSYSLIFTYFSTMLTSCVKEGCFTDTLDNLELKVVSCPYQLIVLGENYGS